jgi:pantothenate kinase
MVMADGTKILAWCLLFAVFVIGHVQGFGTNKRSFTFTRPSATKKAKSTSLPMSIIVPANATSADPPTEKKVSAFTVSWEPEMARKNQEFQKARQGSTPTRPFMVGVVGIPGAGKTTSAGILASMLDDSIVMPMDGYHYSLAQLARFPDPVDAIYRRGAPDTFDPASLQKDLARIARGDEPQVSIPGFDHAVGDPEENKHTFVRGEHKVVICEGIYLMHEGDGWNEIKSYFDWIIYIAADIDTCINRLKERNKRIPGYTAQEIVLRCDAVDRVNAQTVEKSRKFASAEVKFCGA